MKSRIANEYTRRNSPCRKEYPLVTKCENLAVTLQTSKLLRRKRLLMLLSMCDAPAKNTHYHYLYVEKVNYHRRVYGLLMPGYQKIKLKVYRFERLSGV